MKIINKMIEPLKEKENGLEEEKKIKGQTKKLKESSKPQLDQYCAYPFSLKMKQSDMVFKVEGDYPDVIRQLEIRGWRNSEITSESFFFLWSKSSKIFKSLSPYQIVNHLMGIQELSQKIRLCDNLKDISKAFFPECYKVENNSLENFPQRYLQIQEESHLRSLKISCEADINSDEAYEMLQSKNLSSPIDIKNYLESIEQSDPQYKLRGTGNVWIVKPGWMSRGRGIKVLKDFESIQNSVREGPWVIQKYIENPLLIKNRKFDIRQWVLITSNTTLNAYFYTRCYLRFSADYYDISNIDNLYIHLTNNSIAKYSENFKEQDSMWHSEEFQNWIINHYGRDLWPEMHKKIKEIVEITICKVKSKIFKRRKCFELLGYDFMVDDDFNPWLIEVNSSPAMDYSTVIFT